LIAAASTLLLASGAWAGGTYPQIDYDGQECWVFDSDAPNDFRDAVLVQGDYDIKAILKVRGSGVATLVATCRGNDPTLVAGEDFKKPFHFDYNDALSPCEIGYDGSVYTNQWRQTLKPNGDFFLKCIKQFGP
jgi:hypothetical protein